MTCYSKNTKKGVHWYYQFIQEGEYYRGGGYATKREAQDQEHAARNSLSPNPRMAFGELCDKYLTYIKQRGQAERWVYEKTRFIKKHLQAWFRMDCSQINRALIEEHLFERNSSVSGDAANKSLKFIRAIFTFGIQMGYCLEHPCKGLSNFSSEERVKYIPSVEDFMKVYMVADPIEKRLLILLFCTAARVSEILTLKWVDVTPTHVILRSRKHKEGQLRERRIPLNSTMRDALAFLGKGFSEYVFENKREGTRYLRRPKLMASLCKKAGVKPFGFHSIRHLATSVLVNQHEDIQTLKDLLGHAKITTTQIYVHSIEDSLSTATEKLGEIFNDHSTISDGKAENSTKIAGNRT